MYAVIETGGKQYRVEVGTQLEVELIDAQAGDTVTLERVLLVADGDTTAIGRPLVAEASVRAEVVRQERGPKVVSFKYRPKARRRVKKGHRQELHVLRIADIVLNGKSAATEVRKAEADAKTERQRLEEAARRQAAEDAALAAKLAAGKAPKAEPKAKATAAKPTGRASTAKAPAPAAKRGATAAKTDASSAAGTPSKPAAKRASSAKSDDATTPAAKKPRSPKKDG